MKFIKISAIFFLSLLFANTVTWYFIGKEKAIFLSLNYFGQVKNYPQVDTLFVTTGFYTEAQSGPSRFIKQHDYSAFSDSLKNEYLEKLSQRSEAKKILYREDFDLINWQLPNLLYQTSIDYEFPFVTDVFSRSYESDPYGYGTHYQQSYIWLFKWIPIGSSNVKSE